MKFYSIYSNVIETKDHHIKISYWAFELINLDAFEFEKHKNNLYLANFQIWRANSIGPDIELYEFLKTKHTFIGVGIYRFGCEMGINTFELNEYDLMYIRLMGWL